MKGCLKKIVEERLRNAVIFDLAVVIVEKPVGTSTFGSLEQFMRNAVSLEMDIVIVEKVVDIHISVV